MSVAVTLTVCMGWSTFNVREKSLIFREVSYEAFQSTSDHRVLAHEDNGGPAQRLSDFVHLS
jgi:rRNA maturation protein Rpf1